VSENWRSEQIKDWEEKRRAEVKLDLFVHWQRSIGAFGPSLLAWACVEYFKEYFNPSFASIIKFSIAFLCAVYLLGRVIVWLRLWGAYIERQLIDIRALISNELPSYYQSGDAALFEPNVLFEKLTKIEHQIEAIRTELKEKNGAADDY
jgi:hypothetical protein